MRSFFVGVVAVFFLFVLAGCSSALEEKNASSQWGGATGSVKVALAAGNDERKLDVSTIKNVRYTVESSDMVKMSGTASVNGGRGEFSIESIPVGKNRIISIRSDVKGFEISEVVDIKAGENTISTINWITSARANVYKKLLGNGKKIAEFTAEQNDWISKTVPAKTAAYLVDVDSIVSDFTALRTGNTYVLNYGTVSFQATSANGFVVCINDPCSESKTVSSDNAYTIGGVAPGEWGYTVTDNSGKVTEKSVVIRSGETTTIDPIGNPLSGRLFVFVKASSAPKIWAWETTGSKVELSVGLGEAWNMQPTMAEATKVYMANPAGWYMKDFTNAKPSGGEITFKLNQADPEIASGKTSTFWYDGEKFYDVDPTANQLSDDTSLSDIKVNGTSIGASTTTYSIDSNVSTVTVTATPTDSSASVSVSPSGATTIAEGASSIFTITVTAANGSEKKYMLSVKRMVANDTSIASVKVGNTLASASGNTYMAAVTGSGDELNATITVTPTDSNAKVVCTPSSVSLKDGGTAIVKITVTNGTKTGEYTLNVSYKKSAVPQSQFYWTNKDGMVGTNKTIKTWSDWTSAEQIAQCAAYDDPRTWRGIQEVPYDVYALYAAYDDTNLYLLVELTNIADDDIFMAHDYAGSDNAWWDNRDIPIGFIINTDGAVKSPQIAGTSEYIWGSINFSDINGFDYLLYHSSKYGFAQHEGKFVGVGTPGFFKATQNGFSYDDEYCMSVNSAITVDGNGTPGTSGVVIRYNRGCVVSGMNIYYESTPKDNRTTSNQTGEDLLKSTTYSKVTNKHNSGKNLDMSYWYTIPLSTIGKTKADLESTGIGVRQITPNGGSLMDCCPWDVSMVDNASEPCSDDESTSKEKEDVDEITSPQARVGHM